VFKDGIRIVSEEGVSSSRYFSDKETRELFTLGPEGLYSICLHHCYGCEISYLLYIILQENR
jgi:hypothetical protein